MIPQVYRIILHYSHSVSNIKDVPNVGFCHVSHTRENNNGVQQTAAFVATLKKSITENIEAYAENIYLEDSTGENFIEDVVHATNLPNLISKLSPQSLNKPILEMGYGAGTITTPLVDSGCVVEIIEGSSKLCDNAKEKYGDSVKVHCQFFENFIPIENFQTVLSLHVLEHVDNPEEVVSKIYDWLNPGGQVIVVVPNAESLHRRLAVMMGLQPEMNSLSPRDKIVGHQRVMSLSELELLFQKSGFKIIETFGYFLKTVPNSMMINYPTELIKALTISSYDLSPALMANIGLVAIKP